MLHADPAGTACKRKKHINIAKTSKTRNINQNVRKKYTQQTNTKCEKTVRKQV